MAKSKNASSTTTARPRAAGRTDSRSRASEPRAADAKEHERPPFWSRETLNTVLVAGVIFLVIRIFLIEPYHIPSDSMEPTLLVGDFLFVNNLAYGPHIPFTSINLPGYRDPVRGEVAVYRSPDARDGNPTVVKRIVGIPGDTLYMRDGILYVNGVAKPRPPGPTPAIGADDASPDFEWQKRVALHGSRFGEPPAQPTHDNWGPFVVPPRHYFSLGDNRYDSKDARYYGFVPRENMRGHPLFIYYSYNVDSDRPLAMVTDPRWSRIGDAVR
ncbi:MAG TPA: signal peptidase I [Gemmatimonadaceae bacterium]|nr:signal peptidase I [Gemmatimonadaceae bacterium]